MNYYREVENLIKRGEKRAKYGDGLIKEWREKLSLKYSKGYNARTLERTRKLYTISMLQLIY